MSQDPHEAAYVILALRFNNTAMFYITGLPTYFVFLLLNLCQMPREYVYYLMDFTALL